LTNGIATFGTSSLGAGTHTITTVYGGDANYNASTSAPLSQTVMSRKGPLYLPLVQSGPFPH
jgi:hypothetical protein